jgi:hypothetical protein
MPVGQVLIQGGCGIIYPTAARTPSGTAVKFGKPPDTAVTSAQTQHTAAVFDVPADEPRFHDERIYRIPRP